MFTKMGTHDILEVMRYNIAQHSAKGNFNRTLKTTKEARTASARKAATARWHEHNHRHCKRCNVFYKLHKTASHPFEEIK